MFLSKLITLAALIFSLDSFARTPVEKLEREVRHFGEMIQRDPGHELNDQIYGQIARFSDRVGDIINEGLTRGELTSTIKTYLFTGWSEDELAEDHLIAFIDMLPEELPTVGNSEKLDAIYIMRTYWATVIGVAVVAKKKMYTNIDHFDDGADRDLAVEARNLSLSAERLGSAALLITIWEMYDLG